MATPERSWKYTADALRDFHLPNIASIHRQKGYVWFDVALQDRIKATLHCNPQTHRWGGVLHVCVPYDKPVVFVVPAGALGNPESVPECVRDMLHPEPPEISGKRDCDRRRHDREVAEAYARILAAVELSYG